MPDLKCILLIPQDHFMELQRLDNIEGFFNVTWDKYVINLFDQVPITINYKHTTHLPMVHAYKIIYINSEYL